MRGDSVFNSTRTDRGYRGEPIHVRRVSFDWRRVPRPRRSAPFVCFLVLSACSGVSTEAVRDTTAAITAQVALAKASLVACRGGNRDQCDSAEKNLEAVAGSNAQLSQLADSN